MGAIHDRGGADFKPIALPDGIVRHYKESMVFDDTPVTMVGDQCANVLGKPGESPCAAFLSGVLELDDDWDPLRSRATILSPLPPANATPQSFKDEDFPPLQTATCRDPTGVGASPVVAARRSGTVGVPSDVLFRRIAVHQKRYLAHYVMRLYCAHREAVDEGYELPRRFRNHGFWWRIASRLLGTGLDPTLFVFAACREFDYPAWPTSMQSPALILEILDLQTDEQQGLPGYALHVSWQDRMVRSRTETMRMSLEEILTDRRSQLQPEFVWCMAVRNQLTELEKSYRSRAVEAITRPKVWKAYVAEFRKELSWLTVLEAESALSMKDVQPPVA